MAVYPFMVRFIGSTVLVSVLVIHTPAAAQSDGRAAQIVVDADTNQILYEYNAQASRRPASITKVMTLYLLFDALKKGNITWDERISFSRNATNQPPTKLFVSVGNSIPVQTAVEALVLRSANDVATAVAERLGGSEPNFARMMTDKARELGMSSTIFRNASGLPNATQRTTAEDLARLAIAIHRDFPDQYHWFSAQQMTWNGQTIGGHNHLMARMTGMDGLKTGYTNASGFNLAATTQRSGRRIVTVVLGGANRFQRDDLVEALTESAYRDLGIGGPQFATNATVYDINFRDTRDAADAAALVMDLPARRVTTGGNATFAMIRSGRQLSFERGAPTFQVADMTQPNRSGLFSTMPAQREDLEIGATDEAETEAPRGAAAPVPVRVVAQQLRRVPVPAPVPVRVVVAGPAVTPPSVPLRRTIQPDFAAPRFGAAPVSRSVFMAENPQISPSTIDASSRNASNSDLRGAFSGVTPNTAPDTAPLQNTQLASIDSMLTPPKTSQAATPDLPIATETEQARMAANVAPVQVTEIGAARVGNETAASSATGAASTLMAEMARQDAAALASTPAPTDTSERRGNTTLNGSINLAEYTGSSPTQTNNEAASVVTAPAPVQMAELEPNVVARAQQAQAAATAREQIRINEAEAIEIARRDAARAQAAATARAVADRQATELRAERQLAETRLRAQKEKDARDAVLAERTAAQDRAVAAREEESRQADATRARNARGNAIVQVGAFKDKADANAAIAQFARFFPSFAQREVTSVSRRDGIWYRARFAGLGVAAAGEACRLVSGRGGVCAIVGD